MRARQWIVFALIPLARSAEPPEVTVRNGPYVPRASIFAQSNLVESAVTVFDLKDRAVGGFAASDFALLDNGKPQKISVFSELRGPHGSTSAGAGAVGSGVGSSAVPVTPQDRSVGLFFDDLHLTASLPTAVRAAEKLIGRGIQPGSRMGIFTDSGDVTVDFTSDAATLLAALHRIKSHPDPADKAVTNCPTLTTYTAFLIREHADLEVKERAVAEVMSPSCDGTPRVVAEGTVQDYAASVWENSRHRSTSVLDVLKVLVAHLGKQNGSRILVLMSEGFIDDELMRKEKSAIFDEALRSHVTINSLATQGLTTAGLSYRQLFMNNTMTDAAAATGGKLIKNNNDLDGALGGLASAPEVSYLAGFQAGEPDGKYHTLKVQILSRSGLRVEARPGYFAALPAAETVQHRIDGAVLSRETIRDLPASVRLVPVAQTNGGYALRVVVDVDARHISFASQGRLRLQQLTFVTAIQDADGNFLSGKQAVMDLRVKPESLAKIQSTGLHATLSFALPRGKYTVREVVRELVQNHLAALNTAVQLQ